MRFIVTFVVFLSSSIILNGYAKDKLVTAVLNSPVKETFLKVKLEGFSSIAEVFFKPKNGGIEEKGILEKSENTYVGKFKASLLKPGNYEFRVKVKTTSGSSAQDEAASVTFISFVIDPSLEVADPGEKGDESLLGVDSDNSNVRDDIQRYINETYVNKESTKNALKQMAKSMNLRLANVNDKTLSNSHAHNIMYAIGCLEWIDSNKAYSIEKDLRKRFYNTPDRIKEKMKASSNFHGEGYGPKEKDLPTSNWNQLCDFTPEKNN